LKSPDLMRKTPESAGSPWE